MIMEGNKDRLFTKSNSLLPSERGPRIRVKQGVEMLIK